MKIFITGASGYIGGSVAKTLTDEGHEVYGLLRNVDKAEALRRLGIIPVLGTLEDSDILAKYAQLSDAVINTADSDHKAAIEVFIDSLRGSGKTVIHLSGSSIVGDDAEGNSESDKIFSDDTPFTPMPIREERTAINNLVRIAGIEDGIKAIVITPSMVYGNSLGLPSESNQLPALVRMAKERRAGVYVGQGINRWSNVHINDLVRLFSLALEKGPSGAMFYAENGDASFLTIATAISDVLGFDGKTISLSMTEAIGEFGDWARYAIASNSRIRATNARKLLGWKPKSGSILTWIKDNVC